MKRAGADGVVFAAPSFCDPALLDQPPLQKALSAAGVPFFFKQWGEWGPGILDRGDSMGLRNVGKKVAGRLLDGREWSEFPKVTPHA